MRKKIILPAIAVAIIAVGSAFFVPTDLFQGFIGDRSMSERGNSDVKEASVPYWCEKDCPEGKDFTYDQDGKKICIDPSNGGDGNEPDQPADLEQRGNDGASSFNPFGDSGDTYRFDPDSGYTATSGYSTPGVETNNNISTTPVGQIDLSNERYFGTPSVGDGDGRENEDDKRTEDGRNTVAGDNPYGTPSVDDDGGRNIPKVPGFGDAGEKNNFDLWCDCGDDEITVYYDAANNEVVYDSNYASSNSKKVIFDCPEEGYTKMNYALPDGSIVSSDNVSADDAKDLSNFTINRPAAFACGDPKWSCPEGYGPNYYLIDDKCNQWTTGLEQKKFEACMEGKDLVIPNEDIAFCTAFKPGFKTTLMETKKNLATCKEYLSN